MNHEELREEELLALQKAMQEDAEGIEIPESLTPEAIKEKLENKKSGNKILPMRHFVEVAAACAALVIVTGIGGNMLLHQKQEGSTGPVLVGETQENKFEHATNVGDMYVLAKNYEEVYGSISYMQIYEEDTDRNWLSFNSGNRKEFGFGGGSGYIVEEAVNTDEATSTQPSKGNGAANGFSTTNLQVQGVDESDVVKTDGKYIYIVNNNAVTIIDIQEENMKELSMLLPDMRASDHIRELYVDGDRLYLIAECARNTMRKTDAKDQKQDVTVATVLFTYDIQDRENPSLLGLTEVEGRYKESRKVGDYVYLFTTRNLWNVTEQDKEQVIPYVQQKLFPEDCIYIREASNCEFLMVSVDVKKPSEVVDQVMVVNNAADVYVGTESIYLYNTNYYNYSDVGTVTEIAKFTYKDGHINAAGANSVRGTVEDTFAVSEKNGYFRILTTEWSNGRSNNLFLFNEDMKLVGQLDNIAPSESIYAARYVGDYVYFITYRNMDPLFVVDLSDPRKPQILSELEISGFSDYLQMYGENQLLGIGYETDSRSARLGGKLVMFNVENPAEPVIEAVKVDDRMSEIPGTYYYKQILADPNQNLIGFVYESYNRYIPHYVVYQYKDNAFGELMDVSLEGETSPEAIRGLYAGSKYYVVGTTTVQSFNMENGFEEVDMITY